MTQGMLFRPSTGGGGEGLNGLAEEGVAGFLHFKIVSEPSAFLIQSIVESSISESNPTKEVKAMSDGAKALVSVMMGSQSDWDTMRAAHETLDKFGVGHECRVLSAHRTPDLAADYARQASERGIKVIIAGAGGAAHLAGVVAAHTLLPVFGVPMMGWALNGMDALLATVQMPGGVPVGTLSIGKAGAKNAALLAVRMLALEDDELREKLRQFHADEERKIAAIELPL